MHAVKFINSNSKNSVGPMQKIVSVAEAAEKGFVRQRTAGCSMPWIKKMEDIKKKFRLSLRIINDCCLARPSANKR